MPKLAIADKGCRACSLCVEVCPTDVLEMSSDGELAKVSREEDCIGCTSCVYICPSRCITVSEYEAQRPFHRIEQNSAIVEKLLQERPMAVQLSEKDFDAARADVSVRLYSLTTASHEVLGRGLKMAGRKAGAVAATHFPELYEVIELPDILAKLQDRFRHCFDFEPTTSGTGGVKLAFTKCALGTVVDQQGEERGTATLCTLYHEYWAGLLSVFTKKHYEIRLSEAGAHCSFDLEPRS